MSRHNRLEKPEILSTAPRLRESQLRAKGKEVPTAKCHTNTPRASLELSPLPYLTPCWSPSAAASLSSASPSSCSTWDPVLPPAQTPTAASQQSAFPPSGGSASSTEPPQGTLGTAPSPSSLARLTSPQPSSALRQQPSEHRHVCGGGREPHAPAASPLFIPLPHPCVPAGPRAAVSLPGGSLFEERGCTHFLSYPQSPASSKHLARIRDTGVSSIPLPEGRSY